MTVLDGPLENNVFRVEAGVHSIGRHTSNDVVVPEAGISRRHCEIMFHDGHGTWCIRDVGSTTGTFFYLQPHVSLRIFLGLMIKIGESELQVVRLRSRSADGIAEGIPELVCQIYEGSLSGHQVQVGPAGLSIGRRGDNNLVIPSDGTVSAHHARVEWRDGDFFLSDLGSSNGTAVRIAAEREESEWHPVLDGDIIGAGVSKLLCRFVDR
mmetsp:Transcript_2867/g.5636  ORF Transcript_2867/g.5636 Transcript_2867/m.5636 type:complete len:210 (-) Transcript_2867:14-643(-)